MIRSFLLSSPQLLSLSLSSHIELRWLDFIHEFTDNDRWLHKNSEKKKSASSRWQPHARVVWSEKSSSIFFFGVGDYTEQQQQRKKKGKHTTRRKSWKSLFFFQCFDSEQLWYQMLTRPTKCSRFPSLMMDSIQARRGGMKWVLLWELSKNIL